MSPERLEDPERCRLEWRRATSQGLVFNTASEFTGVRALPAVMKAGCSQAWPAGVGTQGQGHGREAEITRKKNCFISPVGFPERLGRAPRGHLAHSDLCSGQGLAGWAALLWSRRRKRESSAQCGLGDLVGGLQGCVLSG